MSLFLAQPELIEVLKRVGNSILEQDGVLRKIEFLGHRRTPFSISNKSAPGSKRIVQARFVSKTKVPPDVV